MEALIFSKAPLTLLKTCDYVHVTITIMVINNKKPIYVHIDA